MTVQTPTDEQEQRDKWDLLLLDVEVRTEQLRQLETYEGWRLAFQGMGAGATLFAAGAALATLVFHFMGRL